MPTYVPPSGAKHPSYASIDKRLRSLIRRKPNSSLRTLSQALGVNRDTVRSHLGNLGITLRTQKEARLLKQKAFGKKVKRVRARLKAKIRR